MSLLTVVLRQPDAIDLLVTDNSEALADLNAAIELERGKIARARADYKDELIDGLLYKEIRNAAEAVIAHLDSRRIALTSNPALESLLRTDDPGLNFLNADLATKRQTIDGVITVALLPHPRGRKTFDPETVKITWRTKAAAHG